MLLISSQTIEKWWLHWWYSLYFKDNEQTFDNQTVTETMHCVLESKLDSYVWYWYFFSLDSIETLPSRRHFQFWMAMFKEKRHFCKISAIVEKKLCGTYVIWQKNFLSWKKHQFFKYTKMQRKMPSFYISPFGKVLITNAAIDPQIY